MQWNDSKIILKLLSHNWLILRKLCLHLSFKLTLSIKESPIPILPILVILHCVLSLRVINAPFKEGCKFLWISCPRNHPSFLIIDLRHSYNTRLTFLRYPNHFKSHKVNPIKTLFLCSFLYPSIFSFFKITFSYITWWWCVLCYHNSYKRWSDLMKLGLLPIYM